MTFDLLGKYFEHQNEKSDMLTLDTKLIIKQFYTEFPNPTDDEIEILSQMIQQEHPSEKIQKWFLNAPNSDDGWTPIDFAKVFGYSKSVESPAP